MTRFIQNSETLVAAATGSEQGLGKISTVAASGVAFFRLNCDRDMSKVDWVIQSNQDFVAQCYRARTNVIGGTITFTDATGVDADDVLIFNGLSFTFKAGDNVLAAREVGLGANNAAAAVNLAAMLQDPTYGVPGIGAITITSPATTDVLTIAPGRAPVYQFNLGANLASSEALWAETTLSGLVKHGAALTDTTAAGNSLTAGTFLEQHSDGWPYCYLGFTNSDAGGAATISVKATRYWR